MRTPTSVLLIAMWACGNGDDAPSLDQGRVPHVPPGLHEESVVLDPVRDRLVLFGGMYADSTAEGGYSNLADTYEVADARWWRRLPKDTMPFPRALASLEFDPRTARVNLFGGVAYAPHGAPGSMRPCPSCPSIKVLDDRWEYDGGRWERRESIPSVTAPRALFDSRRQAMLLLGTRGDRLGIDGSHPILLWREAADGSWDIVDTTGPRLDTPPRAAFDPVRGVLVLPVLRGPDAGVWEWNERWRRITAQGPSPRVRFVVTYDDSRNAIVLFGGRADEQRYLNDLWSWDGTQWRSIGSEAATVPSPRSDGSLIHDPRAQRLILIGGLGPGDVLHRETWSFANDAWTRLP